jgi:hypothetical protein
MIDKRIFSVVNSEQIESLRKQLDGQKRLSGLLSREIGRYRELMEQSFPDFLEDDDILKIAQKCAELRKSSAGLWWECWETILGDLVGYQTNKAERLAILSFIDTLGKNPTLEDVSRLATAWGL